MLGQGLFESGSRRKVLSEQIIQLIRGYSGRSDPLHGLDGNHVTYRPVSYVITIEAMERIRSTGISTDKLNDLFGKDFSTAAGFKKALSEHVTLTPDEQDVIMTSAEIDAMDVTRERISKISLDWFTKEQKKALYELDGREFIHKWQLNEALAEISPHWRFRENDKDYNRNLQNKLSHIYRFFRYETDY